MDFVPLVLCEGEIITNITLERSACLAYSTHSYDVTAVLDMTQCPLYVLLKNTTNN